MKLTKIEFDSIDILREYLTDSAIMDCAFCLGNIILWADMYNVYYTIVDDMLVFISEEEGIPSSFTFPIGIHMDFAKDIDNPLYIEAAKKAFYKIIDYFKDNNLPIRLHCITPEVYKLIDSFEPGRFIYTPNRDYYDYIYSTNKLATLKGNKLHKKRNHINNFLKRYPDYIYEDITKDNAHMCLNVLKLWLERHSYMDEESLRDYEYEYKIVELSLNNMDKLNMMGGLIRIGDKPIAFTIGEPLCHNTYDIHFEKADDSIPGAYQMINREFVARKLLGYEYINREEDLGIEGLRKSKLSYYPDILYETGKITES